MALLNRGPLDSMYNNRHSVLDSGSDLGPLVAVARAPNPRDTCGCN
uniref:Uncharacterized protein n=1 Tax=Arundo donax TaxID=35708 RepID=A0A0A9B1Y1_ARUDO